MKFSSLAVIDIREIDHERAFLLRSVQHTQNIFTLETRGPEHIAEILDCLASEGITEVDLLSPVRIYKYHNRESLAYVFMELQSIVLE